MKIRVLIFSLAMIVFNAYGQTLTQVVKGRVIDAQATYSLPGANIILNGSSPVVGTVTDPDGYFRIEGVPVGRHTLIISYLGYHTRMVSNIEVNSAKEVFVEIQLEESVQQIEEATVIGSKPKDEALNEMALISSRSFTVDEATRYAGSLNDPARMAANYAGVASSDDMRNDITVRGNSPNSVQYRLEGLEIPNPNHLGTTGASGGYYSMLSQNMLSNSDFLTGAFPAQYGNALGGIFDINFRKGNNEKREYAFTFGFNGIELTAEGPFSNKSKASYLINYRYSTLEAFDIIGIDMGAPAVPKYQDLSVKIHIPLKSGYLKAFGLTGAANINLKDSEVEAPEDYFNVDTPSDIYSSTGTSVFGISNKYFFNSKMYGELTLAGTRSKEIYYFDTLSSPDYKIGTRTRQGEFEENKFTALYNFSIKLNRKHKLVAGIQAEYLDLFFNEQKAFTNLNQTKYDGHTTHFSGYVQWLYRISDRLSYSLGAHSRYFDLTKSFTFEPRTSIKWAINEKQSVNAGFGVHSQGLPSYAYFIDAPKADGTTYYKYGNVSPSISEHYIIGYNYHFANNFRLKIEAYYQYLYNIPVESTPSHWSAINVGGDFEGFPDDLNELVNDGFGDNKGVELTLEKFLSKGYYFLLTSSLYDSKYKGSDEIERNTAFNSNYVFNFLAGKEIKVGKSKQNSIGLDFRTNLMGGRRYIPIDYEATQEQRYLVYDYDKAYENKHNDYFRADIKISYTLNRPKVTHTFILDLTNITNNQNIYKENYNISTGAFSHIYQPGFMPNFQYKILF